METALLRAADVFFTVVLVLMALLGIVLVWMMGELVKLSLAMLLVGVLAPAVYRRLRI